jgi:hypothetical protein
MARFNLWSNFQSLIPKAPLLVGEVIGVNSNGTCSVTMPGGGNMRVIGASTVGKKVFIKDGVIQGEAPDLDYYELEV